ncbi:MAG: glycosyltransferase family 2 protein [Candidatus Omnitrophica bacterium]|nr:glycosyltransferase family 2 protein [Candidatus Omnitrophota bacterium]
MSCDIIIPIWNHLKFTKECVESIIKNTSYPYKLILIDNGSDRRTWAYLETLNVRKEIMVIRNEENLGFVKAVNQGLKVSKAPYICIMNNDTIATEGWLSEMVDVAESDKFIGLLNPSSNNLGQHKGYAKIERFAEKLKAFKGQYIEMGACIGFSMLMKRELYKKIGQLDEVYGSGNFDDTDYSRRAEKEGYICVRAKGAYVYHHIKTSFTKIKSYEDSFRKNQEIYNKRWGRPKRLLYVVTKGHGKLFDWIREDILKKARGGNWVWLYFKKDEDMPQIAEHSNIKLIYLPKILFDFNCLVRIIKKKKRFDSIFVDDTKLIGKIEKYNNFHKAETMLMGG